MLEEKKRFIFGFNHRFTISGKTMQEHLSRMHGIDVENPPDHIKHILQLNNPGIKEFWN